MIAGLPDSFESIKGFLSADEGEALYRHALEAGKLGPVLEIGSYCGKSSVFLGLACRHNNRTLFALDHHRGSEEHQPGEFFHDPDLFNKHEAQFDSFQEFRRNIRNAGLEETVVPLVAGSAAAARDWRTGLGMVFIDGGHSLDAALLDYRSWSPWVLAGGILAIHDLFEDAHKGGQAPFAIYRMAVDSGQFSELERTDSLGILLRL